MRATKDLLLRVTATYIEEFTWEYAHTNVPYALSPIPISVTSSVTSKHVRESLGFKIQIQATMYVCKQRRNSFKDLERSRHQIHLGNKWEYDCRSACVASIRQSRLE
mmetsp:Transcript_31314/g.76389  ORF Transcript_31314/g.76389 Transcript_31314/m.76389 type:complete len:107 (-) Transcript_31314:40-360(-)